MKRVFLVFLFLVVYSEILFSQISSNNTNKGMVFSSDILEWKGHTYTCGVYVATVKICNSTLNGYCHGSPFLVKTNKENTLSSVLQPSRSHTGYSTYDHIYASGDFYYLTGTFIQSIILGSDTINAGDQWKTFVMKLDARDSLLWFKVLDQFPSPHSPQLLFSNNNIFVSSEVIVKDSTKISVLSLDLNDGTIIEKHSINCSKEGHFIGFDNRNDTVWVYYESHNSMYRSIITASQVNSGKNYNCPGTYLSSEISTGYPVVIAHESNGSLYKYNISVMFDTVVVSHKLLSSSFLGSINVLETNDSFMLIGGFFNDLLEIDSVIYIESDSSNSFILKYDYRKGKAYDFQMINYINVFKFKKIDSTIYLISNYIDGGEMSKRDLIGEASKSNSDFKIGILTYKPDQKITSIKEFNTVLNDIVLFPNINSGEKIYLKINNNMNWKSIELFNILGQKISSYLEKSEEAICIRPINNLKPGIYTIEIIETNGSKKMIKFVVGH